MQPSGQFRVCVFSSSGPRVGFRFLLLQSAVSWSTRSFCRGGVMKQGRAPDMMEGKMVGSFLPEQPTFPSLSVTV